MREHWQWYAEDEACAASLRAQLPASCWDAHAHWYRQADLGGGWGTLLAAGPPVAGHAAWQAGLDRQMGPGRVTGGLFFAMPSRDVDRAAANRFIVEELATHPECRGLLLISPHDTPAEAARWLDAHPSLVGFKCYHLLGTRQPTFQAPLSTFLPEWAWELADARGLAIMLHLVRDGALADPDNQREVIAACRRYPRARLILAHAARGFHAPNTVRGVTALRGLENVWFDTSGICEAAPMAAILREFGPRRVMWGSDFPIVEQRGKCVTVGDQFCWINPDRIDPNVAAAPEVRTLPVGLENLRALLEAAELCALDATDLRQLCGETARRLFGLAATPATNQALYRRAKELIPGGTHLLSKRPELFAPDQWPPYFQAARGCTVWDLDDRAYTDFSINGIGACLLGYADPAVTRAVQRQLGRGSMCTLNPPEEVALAERLCQLHPWAEQVRLARTGGEVAAIAVRIARATTGRSAVAICGYHGWADWYLAANLGESDALRGHLLPGLDPLGVPGELRGTADTFRFDQPEELAAIVAHHGDRLAAVVMEPCRYQDPAPGFLERVRALTTGCGALLVFDEITIGWRLALGGAHLRLGVAPDLALFAKALGNGHPIAAVIGTRAAMAGAATSFISSSYWTESIGPVAALATLERMAATDVVSHIARIGTQVQELWRALARDFRLPLVVKGYPCAPSFVLEHPEGQALRTLFTQEMLRRGFLAGSLVYITLAHGPDEVAAYGAACREVAAELAAALAAGDVAARLRGPVAHSGFRRLL